MAGNYPMFYGSKNGDRKYNAASFENWLKPFFTTGVFQNELQVTANGDLTVTVGTGYCNIGGKVKLFTQEQKLDLETPSGTLNRIDSVVIRRNDTERDFFVLVIKGGNATDPVPPQLTREGAIYDIKLADVYIKAGAVKITQSEITDTRMKSDVCGWVCSTCKELDFSQIQAQFDSYFANYKASVATDYSNYKEKIDALNEQAENELTESESVWNEQILDWFNDIKGQISEDAAVNLQLEVNQLKEMLRTATIDVDIVTSDGSQIIGSDGEVVKGDITIYTSLNFPDTEAYSDIQQNKANIGTNTEAIRQANSAINEANSKIAQANSAIKKNDAAIKANTAAIGSIFIDKTNLTLATSAWVSDSTYASAGYGYKADIAVTGAAADMVPEVVLAPANDLDMIGQFATTGSGIVSLYATEIPTVSIGISRISLRKAVSA